MISRTGRYKAFPIAGTALLCAGLFLFSTMHVDTGSGRSALFMIVMGLGLVGQIAAQLARCSGASVLANDLDPAKVELAEKARVGLADEVRAEIERRIVSGELESGAKLIEAELASGPFDQGE